MATLRSNPEIDPAALRRVREAALAELREMRSPSWGVRALRLALALGAFSVVVGGAAAFASGGPSIPAMVCAVHIAALLLLQAAGAWAALAPGRALARGVTVLAAAAVMAELVIGRGAGLPSQTPPWVCTVSHVGFDLIPLVLVLRALRWMSPQPVRALVAGLVAGTVGALSGEVVCGQSARHVALFHLPAWLLVVLAALLLSRWLKPRSFAP